MPKTIIKTWERRLIFNLLIIILCSAMLSFEKGVRGFEICSRIITVKIQGTQEYADAESSGQRSGKQLKGYQFYRQKPILMNTGRPMGF